LTAAGSARLRSGGRAASAEHQRRGVTLAASRAFRRHVSCGSQRAARLRHAGPGAAAESKAV